MAATEESAKPKLTYWLGYGRGEGPRWCLALAGVDFEDYGLQKKEEFGLLKENTLWGVAPILEIDGLTVQQTGAIMNYIGNKYNMYGDNIVERYLVDTIMCANNDYYGKLMPIPFFNNFAESRVTYEGTEEKPGLNDKFLPIFDSMLAGKTYFLGDKKTIADAYVFSAIRLLSNLYKLVGEENPEAFLEPYKNLTAWFKNICGLESIAEYEAKKVQPSLEDYGKSVRFQN